MCSCSLVNTKKDGTLVLDGALFDLMEYQSMGYGVGKDVLVLDTAIYYELTYNALNLQIEYSLDSIGSKPADFQVAKFESKSAILDSLKSKNKIIVLRNDSLFYVTKRKENFFNGFSLYIRDIDKPRYNESTEYFDISRKFVDLGVVEKAWFPFFPAGN